MLASDEKSKHFAFKSYAPDQNKKQSRKYSFKDTEAESINDGLLLTGDNPYSTKYEVMDRDPIKEKMTYQLEIEKDNSRPQ